MVKLLLNWVVSHDQDMGRNYPVKLDWQRDPPSLSTQPLRNLQHDQNALQQRRGRVDLGSQITVFGAISVFVVCFFPHPPLETLLSCPNVLEVKLHFPYFKCVTLNRITDIQTISVAEFYHSAQALSLLVLSMHMSFLQQLRKVRTQVLLCLPVQMQNLYL